MIKWTSRKPRKVGQYLCVDMDAPQYVQLATISESKIGNGLCVTVGWFGGLLQDLKGYMWSSTTVKPPTRR